MVVTRLADVEPEEVHWLWQGRIPLGKITVVDGDPGTGKTTLALDIAARITTGRVMPDKSPAPSGCVLVLTAEDGLADTIRPRLDAMGADVTKVFALKIQAADGFDIGVTLPDDIHYVRQVIEDRGIVLVIVDPLTGFLSETVDSHKDSPIRRALAPLAQLAEDTGVAIVCIRHLNKSTHGKALYRGGGSIAIAAAARSVLLAAEDPEGATHRILAGVKCNLAPPPTSLRYHLEGNLDGATRVIWDGESTLTANVLCAQPTDPDERSAAQELADFVREMLEEAPRTVKEVKAAARAAGYDVSHSTLQRTRRRIGADDRRSGFGGDVIWSLPGHTGHIVVTHDSVTTMETEPPVTPVKTPAVHSGHLHSGQPPVTTMGEPPAVPDSVRAQATEYAIGSPDCSRADVIAHLGLGVPLTVANAALDDLAESEARFARLGAA